MDNASKSESITYSRISITLPTRMLESVDSLCRETREPRSVWIQRAINSRLGGIFEERFEQLAEIILRIERRHKGRKRE